MDDISTDDTSKSKTPIKMNSTSGTASAPTNVPTTGAIPTLVPTQGRKIVLKRRMQVSGAPNETNSASSPSHISNTSACQTPASSATAGQQQQRAPNMTKIRKVEP